MGRDGKGGEGREGRSGKGGRGGRKLENTGMNPTIIRLLLVSLCDVVDIPPAMPPNVNR